MKFTHNGGSPTESFIETNGVNAFKRGLRFRGAPGMILAANEIVTLSPSSEIIDGNTFRTMTDDNSPVLIRGGHYGGQHGLGGSLCDATAHGKDMTDIGSLWSNGGNNYVLLKDVTTGKLLMARQNAAALVPTGTFVHVSGAAHTGNIVVTNSVAQNFHPLFQNYKMQLYANGEPIPDASASPRDNLHNLTAVETYDLVDRADVLAWFVAGNGKTGSIAVQAEAFASMCSTYVFDVDGQLTIYNELQLLQTSVVGWVYGLQLQWSNATHWLIPKTDAFTYNGTPTDFSMVAPVPATMPTAITFNDGNTESGGLFCDRVVSFNASYGCAIGFLPVQDCEPVKRRASMITGSNPAMVISTQKKFGFRVESIGNPSVVSRAAEYTYNWVSYRNIFAKVPERTDSYFVRSNVGNYLFADWHNKQFIDSIPLPPECYGKAFSVVESNNAVVLSDELNGRVYIDVDCLSDKAYLVLKIDN